MLVQNQLWLDVWLILAIKVALSDDRGLLEQAAGHHETAIEMLVDRINSNPNELDRWKPLCLRLVMTPDLIRSGQMANFYWKGAVGRLLPGHARDIAAAILGQHQNRDLGSPWLIANSGAEETLRACVEHDPAGVWLEIQSHLNTKMFSIGFPGDILAKVPPDDIRTWIAQQPADRAPLVAQLCGTDISDDSTLSSIVLGQFGDDERVAEIFFSKYISGGSWGPLSSRWNTLAQSLDKVATRTKLPKLRRWAQKYAETLRRYEKEERQREEEEELHRR